VEDTLFATGQAFARARDPAVQKNVYDNIDFWIQRQIWAYKREESPPKRVICIMAHAFVIAHHDDTHALANIIAIAFLFLNRPG
jgi:hypothetical protein